MSFSPRDVKPQRSSQIGRLRAAGGSSWLRRPSGDLVRRVADAALASDLVEPDLGAVVFHDLDLLDARLDELTAAFPAGTLHAVAIKANALVAVLRRCVERGAGLEAASWEEVALAVAAGCEPSPVGIDRMPGSAHGAEPTVTSVSVNDERSA